MKTFAQYLTESRRLHSYRIKIVGEVPSEFVKQFRDQLKKFDPESIGELKQTPVIPQHQDFPAYPNQRVGMIDAVFRYPATPPQIQQIAKMLGLDDDRISVQQKDYADAMDAELLGIQQQKDLLTNTEYPKDTTEQRALKKDHADGNQQMVKNSAENVTWTVAGGKTPAAETTNELPQGVKSPMTTVKRPPRPATGFKK